MLSKEIARPEMAVFLGGLGVGFVACGMSFRSQTDEQVRSSPFGAKYLAHKLPPIKGEDAAAKKHH